MSRMWEALRDTFNSELGIMRFEGQTHFLKDQEICSNNIWSVLPKCPILQGSYLLSHPTRPCFWAAKVDYNNADQMSSWNTGAGIEYIWFVLEKLKCCKYYSLFCSVNSISSKITGYKLFLSQYIVNMLNRIICKEHQNSWVKYD